MNSASITTTTFTVTPQGGSAVAGTVAYSSSTNTATFTPTANLSYSTQYTVTVTTGVTDSAGTALAANDSWTFTTVAATPPTVTAVTPTSNSTGVAITSALTATFNEAMDPSTITASAFTLTGGGGSVTATVAYSASTNTATLTPSGPLAYSTQYTATITTAVTSSQGAPLPANYTWSFTTATPPPTPTVIAVVPASGATNVALNTQVTATFSEPMMASTITSTTFTLSAQGDVAVNGTVTLDPTGEIATFSPTANLAPNTTYMATITTGVESSAGIPIGAADTWTFSTPPAPTVTSTSPAFGATNVSLNPVVTATFSTAMNARTITSSTFTVAVTGGAAVSGTVSYNSSTDVASFTPSSALTASTSYTATVTTGATSAAGVPLAANDVWAFTTGLAPSQITVDFGTTFQTIRGFGGSTAWLGQMPQSVATALFSPTSGLGLSILRLRIDPTGSVSGGGVSGMPYETSEWDYEAANGMEAVTANPNAVVFASPWTGPNVWKLNGTSTTVDGTTFNEAYASSCGGEGTGYCGGYLDPNHYGDYANYLEDFVTFFNATNSFDLYAISMQNEPEENVTYESCVWTPAQMDAFVASLTAGGATNPITTKLIMPESDDFNPVDASTTLSDTNAQGNVSIIGGHIYQTLFGGSITPYPALPAGDSPKEIWMTEFGPLSSAAPSWSQALSTYALNMHNAMVTGQYNAYVWWGAFGATTGNCATSAGTCGLVDNSGNVTVTGEVMGQYSKFIQPGYVRADATPSFTSGVYVSAYENTLPEHYVIVAINNSATPQNVEFTIDNATVTSMTPYQSTSATGGLAAQPAVSVTGGQFTYLLPAQSIVTFVQ
jgi:O-glycosyl hydrolase